MITKVKIWCQKVLPLEFDDSLSYYELLCKVVEKLNEVVSDTNKAFNNLEKNVETEIANKQDVLVSGDNIKTINGNSLLGSGDIVISGGGSGTDVQGNPEGDATGGDLIKIKIGSVIYSIHDYTSEIAKKLDIATYETGIAKKLDKVTTSDDAAYHLYAYKADAPGGTANQSQLRADMLSTNGGSVARRRNDGSILLEIPSETSGDLYNRSGVNYKAMNAALDKKQDALVSGTNIKTINGNSILGSGNIEIEGGGSFPYITLTATSTATQGTITAEELATLQSQELTGILFNNELYIKQDNGHKSGYLGFSHVGYENNLYYFKNITLTISTKAWVLKTESYSTSLIDTRAENILKQYSFAIIGEIEIDGLASTTVSINTNLQDNFLFSNIGIVSIIDTTNRIRYFLPNVRTDFANGYKYYECLTKSGKLTCVWSESSRDTVQLIYVNTTAYRHNIRIQDEANSDGFYYFTIYNTEANAYTKPEELPEFVWLPATGYSYVTNGYISCVSHSLNSDTLKITAYDGQEQEVDYSCQSPSVDDNVF